MNRQQWLGISGWSSREFDRNIGLGFPARKNSRSRAENWLVDTREGIGWIVAQALAAGGVDGDELDAGLQRARLLRAQADLAELTLGERRGELLAAPQVVAAWQAAIGRARSLLLSLPPAAAEELALAAPKGTAAVRERLADMVHAALAELSDVDPTGEDEDEDPAPAEGGGGAATT